MLRTTLTDPLRWLMAVAIGAVMAGCSTLPSSSPESAANAYAPDGRALAPIEPASIYSLEVRTTAPAQDIWARMRSGFGMPDLHSPLVGERERWYASRPDLMLRMTERSRKYLFHIVEELERRNMPTELALLPFVESAYNPNAVSSAKAAGMWQFMPATGIDYSLAQSAFIDDRRDVLESTRAALDYLQKLHNMFGDWHLALAAYNWGEGSVGRARARNQNAGLPTGYLDLRMPDETRGYVPKLQAIKNIVSNPRAFGVELADIGNHAYFDTATIARDIDVARAAQMAGISEADFRLLNPAHKGPVVFAAVTPEILLPWESAQTFRSNLANHRDGRLASWTVWTAPQRMALADVAQRIGADEQELRTLNAIPRNMLIEGGSALLVPRTSAALADAAAETIANGRLKLTPERRASADSPRRLTVAARKGETVATLAARYKVAKADLARWNKVAPNARFKPGQKVVVLQSARSAKTTPAATRTAKAAAPTGKQGKQAKQGQPTKQAKASAQAGKTAKTARTTKTAQAGKTIKTATKTPGKAASKTAAKTPAKATAAHKPAMPQKTRVATANSRTAKQ